MNRLLMIVDPQVDFISGALPVPGAVPAMDALADYIRTNVAGYRQIIVTADRHPMRHCSFRECGGAWPRHCVNDSVGAAVWPPVMDALCDGHVPVTLLHKGEDAGAEEYSIFQNATACGIVDGIVAGCGVDAIDLCGIAGDVCVASTLTDGMERFGASVFTVLSRFTASIDGGISLGLLIDKYRLKCDR